MIIKKKIAWWDRVEGADKYHVRVVDAGLITDINQLEAISFGVVPQSANAEIEVDINTLGLPVKESTYDVFVSAADSIGNESDPLEFRGAVFDFTPPASPTRGGFR